MSDVQFQVRSAAALAVATKSLTYLCISQQIRRMQKDNASPRKEAKNN